MNNVPLLRPVLALVTCACLACAALFVLAPAGGIERGEAVSIVGPAPDRPRPARVSADSIARSIAARNVFRAARAPASVRFDPRGADGNVHQPPAPPRPAPVVAGIMIGAEPAVLLEGIPGVEGTRVLRAGERVGDYLVRTITPERVVIASRDTTWTLRVRTRFQ